MGTRRYNKPKIGQVFGQWTVISTEIKVNGNKDRNTFYKVCCQCGREGWRLAYSLVNGTTKSCKSCCRTAQNNDTYLTAYFNRVKRRALTSKLEFNITIEYIEQLLEVQDNKCALSGLEIKFRPNWQKWRQTVSLDRIDSTKGYVEGNVQWVHKDVNFMKGKLSQDDFIDLCHKIAKYNNKCS